MGNGIEHDINNKRREVSPVIYVGNQCVPVSTMSTENIFKRIICRLLLIPWTMILVSGQIYDTVILCHELTNINGLALHGTSSMASAFAIIHYKVSYTQLPF